MTSIQGRLRGQLGQPMMNLVLAFTRLIYLAKFTLDVIQKGGVLLLYIHHRHHHGPQATEVGLDLHQDLSITELELDQPGRCTKSFPCRCGA